jgi:hypothetical protein
MGLNIGLPVTGGVPVPQSYVVMPCTQTGLRPAGSVCMALALRKSSSATHSHWADDATDASFAPQTFHTRLP